MSVVIPSPVSGVREFVEDRSGQKVLDCYQCGKCSAGCPAYHAMDLGPRRIMRALQLGMKEEILSSNTIWLCISCETCSSRCPAKIDIARIMESLRWLAALERSSAAEKDVQIFHQAFLGVMKQFGRVHELSLGVVYNLKGKHPLSNMSLVPAMLSKGKMALLPSRFKGAGEVKEIFDKAKDFEKKA